MSVGHRVSYSGELCTIRYVGEVDGTKGEWLGVEWDDPTRGKHNGEAGGRRYFECISKEPKAASFIRPNRPADKERSFLEALRFKYASEHIKISFQIGQPPSERAIRISGKEAEEVGFDKIRKQLANLHELRVVLLDGLSIWQPVDPLLLQSWQTEPVMPRRMIGSDIFETCPKITELDLSRNLFRNFHEVVAICEQLEHVKTLRLDGNRFGEVTISPTQEEHFRLIFSKVENLSLESTLLSWQEIVTISACFPTLKSLSISSNEFERLDPAVPLDNFPQITTIKLESNRLTSLSDISTLSKLPTLRHIILKNNSLITPTNTSHPSITHLDLSYNQIPTWSFIDSLAPAFPSLTSLRISHNPLYTTLHSPAGRELTPEDGYMLTIARLPSLKTLNFSAVTDKDRLNAESYYLSLIAQELALAADGEEEAEKVKKRHPRWRELCEEYGEPIVKREGGHVDPRSLGARLVTLEVELSEAAAVLFGRVAGERVILENVPKRFNIYTVLGSVARSFGQSYVAPGLSLSLITEEWEEIGGQRMKREVKLTPHTRGIGTFLEERKGCLRIDYEEPVRDYGGYEHPMAPFAMQTGVV